MSTVSSRGHVVDEDDLVDEVVRDVGVRALERLRRVVGGHDDDEVRAGQGASRRQGYPTSRVGPRDGRPSRDRPHAASPGPSRDGCATIRAPPPARRITHAMFERLFGSTAVDPAIAERIPPGQYRTEKFPVLHYGSVPRVDLATWDFKVFGEVDAPFTLTWEQFKAAAAQAGPHRHPLRDPLVEARHRLGGRPDPGDPRDGPGPPARDARRQPRRAGLHRERAAVGPRRRRRPARRHVRRRSRSSRSTATRCACSSRRSTSGRARSGSAASSSSTTTSSASGSATATTTTPIPGRKSASAATDPRGRRAAARPAEQASDPA